MSAYSDWKCGALTDEEFWQSVRRKTEEISGWKNSRRASDADQ